MAMRFGCLALAVVLAPAAASADEILLKGGGRLVGLVVSRTEKSVTMETAPGRITLPLSRVERITEGSSALVAYQTRAARLARDDVQGWLQLALWAREASLATQARQAFERVAALDPSNAVAQEALGNTQMDGQWVSHEEAYRRRGYVELDGNWVTPAERDNILAQREAAARMEQADREADARAREAEARAHQAEAEARRAEAEGEAAEAEPQVPWWLPFGGYGRHLGHDGHRGHGRHHESATPAPTPCPSGTWSQGAGCGGVAPWSERVGDHAAASGASPAASSAQPAKSGAPARPSRHGR
jgi:hypothetical protein